MTNLLRSLAQDTSGATAAEYGLMIALIAVAILATVSLLGTNLRDLFSGPDLTDALD